MSILLLFSLKSLLILSASLLASGKWFAASVRHLILLTAMVSVPLVLALTVADSTLFTIEVPADWAATQTSGEASVASVLQPAFPALARLYALVCLGFLSYWFIQLVNTAWWVQQTRLLRGQELTSRTQRHVALHQSATRGTPVSWGLFHPKVVVPVDCAYSFQKSSA